MTAGRRISSWRVSCVMFFQACSRLASPMMAIIGRPALRLSTRPVTRLVAPGPSVASTHARAVRHLGVGVGREGAAALVVDQRVLEAERAAGLVERQQLEAAHAEHRPDAGELQHFGERLAAADAARGVVLLHCLGLITRLRHL